MLTPDETPEGRFRGAAERLMGDAILGVTYVGLAYEDPSSVAWDFGDWHWPEVGLELTMRSGNVFHAIWDSTDTHFQLALIEGPIADSWLPLQATPSTGRAWDVSGHTRWRPFMGQPLTAYDVTLFAPDDPPVEVPVALRLDVASAAVWIVAGGPRAPELATSELDSEDVYLGYDEVLVAFSAERAAALGL